MIKKLSKELYNTLTINEIKGKWLSLMKNKEYVINYLNDKKLSKKEIALIVAEHILIKENMNKQIKSYENNILLTKEILNEVKSNDEDVVYYTKNINEYEMRINELRTNLKNIYA